MAAALSGRADLPGPGPRPGPSARTFSEMAPGPVLECGEHGCRRIETGQRTEQHGTSPRIQARPPGGEIGIRVPPGCVGILDMRTEPRPASGSPPPSEPPVGRSRGGQDRALAPDMRFRVGREPHGDPGRRNGMLSGCVDKAPGEDRDASAPMRKVRDRSASDPAAAGATGRAMATGAQGLAGRLDGEGALWVICPLQETHPVPSMAPTPCRAPWPRMDRIDAVGATPVDPPARDVERRRRRAGHPAGERTGSGRGASMRTAGNPWRLASRRDDHGSQSTATRPSGPGAVAAKRSAAVRACLRAGGTRARQTGIG